jgi:hypothetical protein
MCSIGESAQVDDASVNDTDLGNTSVSIAEEREMYRFFRDLPEAAGASLWSYEPGSKRLHEAGDALARITGYPVEQLTQGDVWRTLIDPDCAGRSPYERKDRTALRMTAAWPNCENMVYWNQQTS